MPDEGAREKLLHLYFAMAFDRPAPSTRLGRLLDKLLKRFRAPDVVIELDRKRAIRALAKKTEGYSGRECSKLMLSVQGAVYATERRASGELVLDDELWHRTVRWKLEEVKPRAAKAVADLRVAVVGSYLFLSPGIYTERRQNPLRPQCARVPVVPVHRPNRRRRAHFFHTNEHATAPCSASASAGPRDLGDEPQRDG